MWIFWDNEHIYCGTFDAGPYRILIATRTSCLDAPDPTSINTHNITKREVSVSFKGRHFLAKHSQNPRYLFSQPALLMSEKRLLNLFAPSLWAFSL